MNEKTIPDDMRNAVCKAYQIPPERLLLPTLSDRYVYARHLTALLLIDAYGWSQKQISQAMGKHVSTISENLRQAQQLVKQDAYFRSAYEDILSSVGTND